MAQAKINTITIETPVQQVVTVMQKEEKQTGVRLDLTMAEAEVLAVVVNRIGGDLKNSPRKYTDRIAKSLADAGVGLDEGHYRVDQERGTLGFLEYPKKVLHVPKAGDRVQMTETYHTRCKEGEQGTVISAAPANDPENGYICDLQMDNGHETTCFSFRFVVVPQEAPAPVEQPKEPRKFQKGDRIRITKASSIFFKEGDTGVLIEPPLPTNGSSYWFTKDVPDPVYVELCLGDNSSEHPNQFELIEA